MSDLPLWTLSGPARKKACPGGKMGGGGGGGGHADKDNSCPFSRVNYYAYIN